MAEAAKVVEKAPEATPEEAKSAPAPADAKPADGEPEANGQNVAAEKPAAEKPSEAKPEEAKLAPAPADAKPAEGQPEAKRQKVAEEKPAAEKPSEAKPEEAKSAAAPAEAKPAEGEPEAKRLKSSPPDLAAVRKQVEYYMSDENLRCDKFFHDKISADAEGYLEMSLILSCNKMKMLRATKEDVLSALKDSKLEIKEDGACVRRPGNAKLPPVEAKPTHAKKHSLHAHDGGFLIVFKKVPAEQSWVQVKEKLKAAMPQKAQLWFVSEVNDKGMCFIAAAPFENALQFFEELVIDVGGAKLKAEVCGAELLQQALKLLPKHIRERREKEARKRQKERNRPILIGTQRFVNVGALRGRVKEILNSRSDGEHLKPDGSDFKLIKALLEHHPKGEEKFRGMVGIKVARSTQGENSCFFMVRENGAAEDFSAKKCLDAIELNPPYVKDTPPPVKKPKEDADAPAAKEIADAPVAASSEGAAATAPEKAGDKKDAAENKAETPLESPKAEDKPVEPKQEALAVASSAPKTEDEPAEPN
jgi:hypothetical protein